MSSYSRSVVAMVPVCIRCGCVQIDDVISICRLRYSSRVIAAELLVQGWLGSRVVRVLDSGAEGPGFNRSRDAVGYQS